MQAVSANEIGKMTIVLIYAGAVGVVVAALVVVGLVISSGMSILGKCAVLVLCLAVAGFVGFTIAARHAMHARISSANQPRSAASHRRLAMLCWGVGAVRAIMSVEGNDGFFDQVTRCCPSDIVSSHSSSAPQARLAT
jgi:hypothetical protein